MSSLRENPVRRPARARPTWLVAVLIAVAVLVVLGLGFGLLSLLRGSGESDAATAPASTAPAACETVMVTPAEVLPKPAKVKVNVYNATDTSGLASKTARAVAKMGFKVGKVANDPVGKPIAGVGQIRYGPKAEQAASLLLVYVPGATLIELDRKGRNVDLAVGNAFTGLAPEPEVVAVLASPSPSASGPGCVASPSS